MRERNVLLVAAGFAPVFQEKKLEDPTLAAARAAIDLVLKGHEPYPALAIDRHWMMVAANASVAPLLVGCAPALLKPPVNVLRLSLHPDGLAPRIANLAEWRSHLIARLKRQIDVTADVELDEAPGAAAKLSGAERKPRPDSADAAGSRRHRHSVPARH